MTDASNDEQDACDRRTDHLARRRRLEPRLTLMRRLLDALSGLESARGPTKGAERAALLRTLSLDASDLLCLRPPVKDTLPGAKERNELCAVLLKCKRDASTVTRAEQKVLNAACGYCDRLDRETERLKRAAGIPPSTSDGFPVLAQPRYEAILRTIHEMGRAFERLPNTYVGKDEEALRDHLILQLEPRFAGSTTGETFNRKGKTDILIRYEKNNVFVAECKFWGGKIKHHEAIDQLLSYLTWRDSKTALVYFVNRKEIVPILEELRRSTAEHKCFVRVAGEKDPSWQSYELHLPGDDQCIIQMAILAFHLPGQA